MTTPIKTYGLTHVALGVVDPARLLGKLIGKEDVGTVWSKGVFDGGGPYVFARDLDG